MHTRQHSRRQTTTRLLLLAAATTAGIGISLALSDDAHASGRDLAGVLDGTSHAVADSVDTAAKTLTAAPPKRAYTAPAHAPRRARTIVDDTVGHADKAARRASTKVRHVADTVDQSAARLPVIGRVIDATAPVLDLPEAPDLTSPVKAVTLPLTGADTTPGGTGGQDSTIGAPQAAPEPAREQPPLSPTVGSGALTLLHPTVGARLAPSTRWVPALQGVVASAPSTPVGGDQLGGGSRDKAQVAPTADNQLAAPVDRWTQPLRWQQATISYIADRDGRSNPPSPPSG